MIAAAYAHAASLAAPALRLMLARRARHGREVPARLPERWGIDTTPRPAGRVIWLHAASVGEAVSVLPVIGALSERQASDLPTTVLLTTGTVTSAQIVAERLGLPGDGRILHRFVPLDVPAWVARFLDHWRPDVAGFVESEIWPNLLLAARRRDIPTALLNARLSARSFAGWRRVPGFARTQFAGFRAVRAQSAIDAARLRALGAAATVAPNLKLAAAPLPCDLAELVRLRALLDGRPIWLAASIHPGEDAVVLAAHAALIAQKPGLLTIVAPRHPRSMPVGMPARSRGEDPGAFWLIDTVGELGLLYRLARVAFLGGSLIPHGGQNPLEAVRLGCVVAVGPHTANFADLLGIFEPAGVARVRDAESLAVWVADMLDRPAERARIAASCAAALPAPGEIAADEADFLLELAS